MSLFQSLKLLRSSSALAKRPPDLTYDSVPQTTRPIFYVKRGDRLIARLKHLLYACRFARQVNGIVGMVWPNPPASWEIFDGPHYHPGYIFDLERFRESGGSDWLLFLSGDTPFPKDGRSLRDIDYADYRNNRFERTLFAKEGLAFYEGHLMQYHFADEDSRRPATDAEIREIFHSIPLRPEITEVLDRIRNDLHGVDYSCIHFRAGDVYHMLAEGLPQMIGGSLALKRFILLVGHFVARTSPIELYDAPVRRLIDEGHRILFASDSPDYIETFRARYGRDRFIDLSRYTADPPIRKAMIDFCALASGRAIYGSRSNYGSLAAALGGSELVTVSAATVTAMSPEEVTELYYRTAVETFFKGVSIPAEVEVALREEIARNYAFVNRLGDKATIAANDPRRRRAVL